MKKIILILLLLLPFQGLVGKHFLFVLYDAGETVALAPVIEDLRSNGEVVTVLSLGTAHTLLPQEETFPEVTRTGDRMAPLPSEQIETWLEEHFAETVVIGVASKIQLQFAKSFKGKGTTIAYYDNFNPIDESDYASLIREIEPEVDLFLTASDLGALSSHAREVHVVGNPDLDGMKEKLMSFDCATIMKERKLDPERPIVAYIGGYGALDEKAVELFAEGISHFPEAQILMCPHPKSNGAIEKRFFDEKSILNDSYQAIALADVVVCHRSTLGIKSLLLGKKVIFVNPEKGASICAEWGGESAFDLLSFKKAMQKERQEAHRKVPDRSIFHFRFLLTHKEGKEESQNDADGEGNECKVELRKGIGL